MVSPGSFTHAQIVVIELKRQHGAFSLAHKLFNHFLFPPSTAPPDITVDTPWVHASDGCEVELVCTLHSEANSDVSLI